MYLGLGQSGMRSGRGREQRAESREQRAARE
jgi:hypothetical protein